MNQREAEKAALAAWDSAVYASVVTAEMLRTGTDSESYSEWRSVEHLRNERARTALENVYLRAAIVCPLSVAHGY